MRGAEILPPPGGSVAAFRLPTPARCDREAPTALREFSQGLALSPGRLPTRQCSPAMVSASRRMRKGSRGPPHPHTPGPFAIGAQRARPRRDQRPHGADQACAAVRPEERKVSLPASFKGHRRPQLRSANSLNPLSSGWPLAGRFESRRPDSRQMHQLSGAGSPLLDVWRSTSTHPQMTLTGKRGRSWPATRSGRSTRLTDGRSSPHLEDHPWHGSVLRAFGRRTRSRHRHAQRQHQGAVRRLP